MDENAVYWIRKFHSELSRNEPDLCSTSLSLKESAFLITDHLLEANSTMAAVQYLCLLDQDCKSYGEKKSSCKPFTKLQ